MVPSYSSHRIIPQSLLLRGNVPATKEAKLSASLQLDPVWCGSSTMGRDHRAYHSAWAHRPESTDCWGRWPKDVP